MFDSDKQVIGKENFKKMEKLLIFLGGFEAKRSNLPY